MLRWAKVTLTNAGTNARAMLAQLRGLGSEADDATAEPYDDAELVHPMGLVSRPTRTANLQALVLELTDELLGVLLRDKGQPPFSPPLDEGETRVYSASAPGVRLRLNADHSIDLETDGEYDIRITSVGGTIVLNGGALEVARRTDTVGPSAAMATWMTQVATNFAALGRVQAGLAGDLGVITSGRTTVKA